MPKMLPKRIAAVLTGVLILGTLAAAPKPPKGPEFGDAVGGLRVALDILPADWRPNQRVEFTLSAENTDLRMVPNAAGGWKIEPVKIEISFVNDDREPLKVNARDLFAGLVRFDIDGPDDASVSMSKIDGPVPRPEGDAALIDPDTGWSPKTPVTFPGLLGNVRYELKKPGEYRVSAVYASSAKGFWNGLVESNVLVFNVVGGTTPDGAPVKGLKLELAAEPKEILIDGEPAKLTLNFTNVGVEPIKIDAWDLPFRNIRIDVIGPNGKPMELQHALVERGMMPNPTKGDYPVIVPGKSWSMTVKPRFPGDFGFEKAVIAEAGEYRLKVTYENKPLPDTGEYKPLVKGSWTGIVASNEVVINVLPEIKRGR